MPFLPFCLNFGKNAIPLEWQIRFTFLCLRFVWRQSELRFTVRSFGYALFLFILKIIGNTEKRSVQDFDLCGLKAKSDDDPMGFGIINTRRNFLWVKKQ